MVATTDDARKKVEEAGLTFLSLGDWGETEGEAKRRGEVMGKAASHSIKASMDVMIDISFGERLNRLNGGRFVMKGGDYLRLWGGLEDLRVCTPQSDCTRCDSTLPWATQIWLELTTQFMEGV